MGPSGLWDLEGYMDYVELFEKSPYIWALDALNALVSLSRKCFPALKLSV